VREEEKDKTLPQSQTQRQWLQKSYS